MDLIAENSKVIEVLSNEQSILSGKLNSFLVQNAGDELVVELSIQLLYSKKIKEILIRFSNVVEYSFYHNSDYNFYFIEDYKFFLSNGFFYISLDPAQPIIEEVDVNDNDFIKAERVHLFSRPKL